MSFVDLIFPSLIAAFMAYASWNMPLRRHVQLLVLLTLALALGAGGILAFRQPTDTFLEALVNPFRWKFVGGALMVVAILGTLAVRLATGGSKAHARKGK